MKAFLGKKLYQDIKYQKKNLLLTSNLTPLKNSPIYSDFDKTTLCSTDSCLFDREENTHAKLWKSYPLHDTYRKKI